MAKAALIERLIKAFESESPLSWGRGALFNAVGQDDRNYRRIIKVIASGRQDLISALEAGSTTPTEAEIMAKGNSSKGSFSKAAKDVSTAIDVPLEEIDIEEETQSRAAIDPDVIMGYSEVYKSTPDSMPPVSLVRLKSGRYVPSDGHCRISAARMAGLLLIKAIVADGTLEDARWFSAGSNKSHGLPRSNADKRRAVVFALKAKPGCSDRSIADHVGVSDKTVASVREEAGAEVPHLEYRVGSDGKTYSASSATRPAKAEKTQGGEDAADEHAGKKAGSGEASVNLAKADVVLASGTPMDKAADSALQLSAQALEALVLILAQLGRAVPPFERAAILEAVGDRVARSELSRCLGWASPSGKQGVES